MEMMKNVGMHEQLLVQEMFMQELNEDVYQ